MPKIKVFWMKINGKKVITPDVTIWPFPQK